MSRRRADLPEVGFEVAGEIDWARRHRLMRAHTALHLLSALLRDAAVTGGSVGLDRSRLDFDLPSAPAKEALEAGLNALIAANHPVNAEWVDEAVLDADPSLVRTLSVKPPRGTGRVRLIRIGAGAATGRFAALRRHPCRLHGRDRAGAGAEDRKQRQAESPYRHRRGRLRVNMDSTVVAAADHAARNWRFPGGGDEHKAMFSRMLLDTFNPYRPAVIDWPPLDAEARGRLIALPIWDIAVQTEGRARLRILSYARRLSDRLLREAFELMAFEEGRHKEVLSHLVRAYGIELQPEPAYLEPRDPEWGFMVTGYSECIDSFFAFGLFELARRSGFFPPAAGGDLRAGDPGGGAAHPVLHELGALA